MNPTLWPNVRRGMAPLLVLLALAFPAQAQAGAALSFATPEAAVDALQLALKANDEAALVALVGDKHKALVVSGDKGADAAQRAEAAGQLGAYRLLDERGPDRRVLLMGAQAWPMAIPLLRQDGQWHFAAEEGAEELLNRRIGSNERNAIQALQAYVAAQRSYAAQDRNGDGVLEYARKLVSTPGQTDGLYWPADASKGEAPSPLHEFLADKGSYLAGRPADAPFRGYHFKLLTRQGPAAPGGAYDYMINGHLIAGFAMLAYPAAYGETGVMSFLVNQNGQVYERDLGNGSAKLGAGMTKFDTGRGWQVLKP